MRDPVSASPEELYSEYVPFNTAPAPFVPSCPLPDFEAALRSIDPVAAFAHREPHAFLQHALDSSCIPDGTEQHLLKNFSSDEFLLSFPE